MAASISIRHYSDIQREKTYLLHMRRLCFRWNERRNKHLWEEPCTTKWINMQSHGGTSRHVPFSNRLKTALNTLIPSPNILSHLEERNIYIKKTCKNLTWTNMRFFGVPTVLSAPFSRSSNMATSAFYKQVWAFYPESLLNMYNPVRRLLSIFME